MTTDELDERFPKMSNPARQALLHAGIRTLEDVSNYTERQIADLHGMGPKAMGPLKETLEAHGLSFKPDTKNGRGNKSS